MNLRQKLREGWGDLSKAIEECSAEASEEAVHHVRTRSRRMEAIGGVALAAHKDDANLALAGRSLLRRLKKIRREAGIVRDLDIHMKLLQGAGGRRNSVRKEEAAKLARALNRRRVRAAAALLKKLTKHGEKLGRAAERFLQSFYSLAESAQQMDTMALATAGVLETSAAMPELDATNLHEFRKRLKISRYIAEANPRSPESVKLAKKLVRVQDAIGIWHDWDALMAEADEALGKKGGELLREITVRRTATYEAAMKIARQAQQEAGRRAS